MPIVTKICNAFSPNMLKVFPATVVFTEVTATVAADYAHHAESCVGHEPTAAVFSEVLGIPVKTNRATVTLRHGEAILVGQYRGPRLEEGITKLPEGATIQWLIVTVK